jgi:hypothetical protein
MNKKKDVVYKFYRRVRNEDDQFVGALAERRKKTERITHASIMNWAKLLAPREVFEERVYFVREER